MKKLFALLLLAFVVNCVYFTPSADAGTVKVVKFHKKHRHHHFHWHRHHHHRKVIVIRR